MLELRNVSRRFGTKTAVRKVSLTIPDGEMVGVIGRSGAGKSTLLRMINRLIDPNEGEIHYRGQNVTSLSGKPLRKWRRECAMIFQQFNLVNRLDVVSNALHGTLNSLGSLRTIFSMFPKEDIHRALDILERLGISEHAGKRAEALSGGQQQRVAIARALMQNPRFILADEPIASLDPLNAKIVMDALRAINRAEGITVVTNLHTLDTAREYCTRIIGMANGEIVFDGAPNLLTRGAVNAIYGADADGSPVNESITSTTIDIAPASVPGFASVGALQSLAG